MEDIQSIVNIQYSQNHLGHTMRKNGQILNSLA